MKYIDRFLNNITMYSLVIKGLACMALYAIILGFTGLISYSGWDLIFSLLVISITALFVNWILAHLYSAPASSDSTLITALILFFILLPSMESLVSVALVTTLAITSKYLVAYNYRHIFNPAVVGAFIADYIGNGPAIWWVGSKAMIFAVIIIAFLVVRKTRRFALFYSAVGASLATVITLALLGNLGIWEQASSHLLSWPIIFFASIMITEPLSTPPSRKLQIIYGLGVGALSAIPFHIGPIYNSPAFALIVGNIFTFFVSLKSRIILTLKSKSLIAKETYEFVFESSPKVDFEPGQYLEYLLPHRNGDRRGIRRYFTIASSPTESELKLGIRMASTNGSSFKQNVLSLKQGGVLTASRLAGDFILPQRTDINLVFIAGGIGITPFRSMVQYLIDKNIKRNITLFYANKTAEDIAYSEIWTRAEKALGLKTVHVLTEPDPSWRGEIGYITEEMIKKYVPMHNSSRYYISGPSAMVENYKKLLLKMGIKRRNIVTDYFPGFV